MSNRDQVIFNKAVERIKSLGYEVYGVQRDKRIVLDSTYAYIRSKDGKRVAYFQSDYLGVGIEFSTCHKPYTDGGNGVVLNDIKQYPEQITEAVVEEALGIVYPAYYKEKQRQQLREHQWSSFDEWKAYKEKQNIKIIKL